MKKHLIIFGSARSNGNTMSVTTQIMKSLEEPLLIDLSKYALSDFNYENEYDEDDFLKIIHIAMEYEILIFATPIYWYTMSASMKRFFDRITDLLSIHKDLGRKLRYKKMAVICSYATHPEGMDGFESIFINTANYLGMKYLGCYFHYSGDLIEIMKKNDEGLGAFINLIKLPKISSI